jgi:hypothetical protein
MFRKNPWFSVQYIAVTPLGRIPCGGWREINLWFSTAEKAQLWIKNNAELFCEYSVCRNYGEVPKGMILNG